MKRVRAARCKEALELCSDTTWLLLEDSAGAGGTIGRSIDELAALFDALRRARAPRHLPRHVPPLRLRHRHHRPRDASTSCSTRSTRASGSTGCARCTSTTRRRRSARTATATRTSARACSASKLGVFLSHPRLQGLPAFLEVPGTDDHGPDANELRKVRRAPQALVQNYRWLILAAGTLASTSLAAVQIGISAIAPELRAHYGLSLGADRRRARRTTAGMTRDAARPGASSATGSASGSRS